MTPRPTSSWFSAFQQKWVSAANCAFCPSVRCRTIWKTVDPNIRPPLLGQIMCNVLYTIHHHNTVEGIIIHTVYMGNILHVWSKCLLSIPSEEANSTPQLYLLSPKLASYVLPRTRVSNSDDMQNIRTPPSPPLPWNFCPSIFDKIQATGHI